MLMRNKRGQLTDIYLLIAELILLAIIGLTFFAWVGGLADDTAFQKNYLARDFALIIDSILTGQGNYQFKYPIQTLGLTMKLLKNEIIFVDGQTELENKATGGLYFFAKGSSVKTIDSTLDYKDGPFAPVFFRNGYEFTIKDWNKGDLIDTSGMNCPYADTKDPNWDASKSIILDSGHGKIVDTITGLTIKDSTGTVTKSEYEFTTKILKSLFARKPSFYSTKGDPNNENDISLNERKNSLANMHLLISFHQYNSSDKSSNDLRVYVSAKGEHKAESIKLGCNIINKIKSKLPNIYTGVSVNVLDLSQISSNDPYQILNNDIISIVIELGNINSDKETDPDFVDLVANAIFYEGLNEGYFS